jgi:uncharacterized protein YbaR (Trm112 family)
VLLELTEILRCPRDHEESFVVCVAHRTEGRQVTSGVVGCPVCLAEFPIRDGELDLTERTDAPPHRRADHEDTGSGVGIAAGAAGQQGGALTAEALTAFLDLRGPGGYLVLAGGAARLAPALVALLPDVHHVVVNAPADAARSPDCSYVSCPGRIPVRAAQVRAVVLGADCAGAPWAAEAARVLLRGLRVVIEDERASPDGISELARGAGVFVGEKA